MFNTGSYKHELLRSEEITSSSLEGAYHRKTTIGITVAYLALSTTSLGLRFYSRKSMQAQLWWDDYWMVLPTITCILMGTGIFIGITYGGGAHQEDLHRNTVVSFMKAGSPIY